MTASTRDSPLYTIFTCDVEGMYPRVYPRNRTSAWEIGVLGRRDDGEYGVPLLMDMLERHGFRGTFFIDVNAADVVGESFVAEVCSKMKDRGHDLQLHFHSHYQFSSHPKWKTLQLEELVRPGVFRDMIAATADRFERLIGHRASVYRGGAYRMKPEYSDALPAVGISVDATVWPDPWHHVELSEDARWRNTPHWRDRLLVVPITHYLEIHPARTPTVRQLNFSFGRRPAYEAMLDRIDPQSIQVVSFMSHSSTFLDHSTDRTLSEILERVVDVHSDAQGRTIGDHLDDFYGEWRDNDERPKRMRAAPATRRLSEYHDFFAALAARAQTQMITLAEFGQLVYQGDVELLPRRSVFPVPFYDFERDDAGTEYVRRYDLDRLVRLEDRFRGTPEDKASYRPPPTERAAAIGAHRKRPSLSSETSL